MALPRATAAVLAAGRASAPRAEEPPPSREPPDDQAAVRAVGLGKSFGAEPVLVDVDLALYPGESLLVRGRSGSGKSTLLHLLAGVDQPTEGRVVLAGQDLRGLDDAARAQLRLRHVGLVFQHFNLIPDLTAEENVRLPMTLARQTGARARALDLLARVDLAARARAFPGALSGGEMQRVAIARALANNPAVVLADEPTANLDEENARRVLQLLARVAEDGRSVLVASHDALALRWFRNPAHLHQGRLRPGSGRDPADDGPMQPDRKAGQP